VYRVFSSIDEAYSELKRELQERGQTVYNKRTNKVTKELIGVMFKVPIDFFMTYYVERPENAELSSAFNEALKVIFQDKSARYALGTPQVNLNKNLPPCPIAVQILIRGKPIVITYFRSQNIEQLPADFAVIAQRTFIAFGEGEIIWVVGSLHLEVD
jgi:hypothetical protein